MKWLITKLAPGILLAVVVIIACAISSHAQDNKARPVAIAPAPEAYDQRQADRFERPARSRVSDRCAQCGARVDQDGRYVRGRDLDRDYRDAGDDRRGSAQVIYVVHINGGDGMDLRNYPQSNFPLSTRWAMPVRNNCGHDHDGCSRY